MGDDQAVRSPPPGTAPGEPPVGTGNSPLWLALGVAIAVVSCAVLAFYRMYSTFPWYDDDGFLLISIRSFLGGHPLYDQTYTSYGPFYYLWRFLIHAVAGVAVTHDASRMVALAEWGMCGLFAALLIRRATGDGLFSATGGLFVFLFLDPVTKEPSHPQLLAMVVTLAAALTFTQPAPRAVSRIVTGLLVGALLAIKPNLGLFVAVGLGLVEARRAGGIAARGVVGLAAVGLPIALLRAGFAEPTVIAYAASCALAALALVLDRRRPMGSGGARAPAMLRTLAWLALGTVVAYVGAAAFVLGRGTTIAGLVDGVLLRPMKFSSAFAGPAPFPMGMVVPAILAVLGAALAGSLQRGIGLTACAGGALGLAVLLVVSVGYLFTGCRPIDNGAETRAGAGWLLAWGTPWAFVLRPAGVGTGACPRWDRVWTRETLVALAVTHMAIGFPAAGTQLSCGASLFVLAALAAAHDVLEERLGTILTRRIAVALVLVAAVVPACAAAATYGAFTSIGLPGARWLRVEPDLATQLQAATAMLRTNGGPFVTVYGMNSFYLWTEMPPPTAANATLWPWMLNETEQSAIVDVLEHDERSAALVVSGGSYLINEATNQVLGRWIRDRTTPVLEVGPGRWQFRRHGQARATP